MVVLERVARGAGATRWYFVTDADAMAVVAAMLGPGSRVTLYFQGHLRRDPTGEDVCGLMYEQMATHGELVLGYPSADAVEMRTDLVDGEAGLTEVILAEGLDRPDGRRSVVWGPWPAAADDGRHAVTVDLVDADGQLRAHPH